MLVKLITDEKSYPFQAAPRRGIITMKDKFEVEIHDMETKGIPSK